MTLKAQFLMGAAFAAALFAGAPNHVADMVALCRHGPPSSRVDNVTSETASADELNLRRAGEAFSVLPTV